MLVAVIVVLSGCANPFKRGAGFTVRGEIVADQASPRCELVLRDLAMRAVVDRRSVQGRFSERFRIVPTSLDYGVSLYCNGATQFGINVRYGFDVSERKALDVGRVTVNAAAAP